jgi:hypothetical protein
MPRYYTHLENSFGSLPDRTGAIFETDDAAVAEAARTAGELVKEDVVAGRLAVPIVLTIEQEDRVRVAQLRVSISLDR